ncbi:MAG: ABC transporter substrate-binding protein [Lachnospiraceae bacterium]|nr:ABC transporter substrate-binding protein [Lachnospiraceae bacterium]
MKKSKFILAVLGTVMCLSACSGQTDNVNETTVAAADNTTAAEKTEAATTTAATDVTVAGETNVVSEDEARREAIREAFLEQANEVVIGDDTVTFTDANGQTLTINKNPQKVYNLYASYTTLWYEAGGVAAGVLGGEAIVENYIEYIGRDITLDEGMEVLATTPHGSKWSAESIVAGAPDLIICSTALSGYKSISSPAEVANIPVIAISYDSFEDYLKWYRVFTGLTEREDLWESVGLNALDKVVDVMMEVPEEGGPEVFIMFPVSGALQANTSQTVLGEMAQSLGAVNIVDSWNNPEGAQRLDINLETVYEADPELILIQCHGGEEEAKTIIAEEYANNPVWNELTAVKNDKIYYLSKLLFHNKPNSRFAEAYQILAKVLYPDKEFSFE